MPKASLISSTAVAADEEKTAVDSSWEEEQSTIDQAEMADKVRRALAEKRRLGTANVGGAAPPPANPPVPTTNAAAITTPAPIITAPPQLMPSIPAPAPPSTPHLVHQASTIPPANLPSPLSIPTPGTIPNPILAPASGLGSVGATTGNTTTGGHPLDEPTVEDRQRPGIEAAALGLARLSIEAGPDAGKDFQLRAGKPILVGRAMDNHVVLTDLSVSRKHLEITWEGTFWMLSDRGSGNGTLLNGKLEEGSFRLFNGDRIEIGHTTFLFEQQGQAARNHWGDEEEPSTIAGRRGTPAHLLAGRPSAAQTSEYEASAAESAAISMVERKPLPVAAPLPRPAASNPPFPAPAQQSDPRFATAPIVRPQQPPKSPPNGSFGHGFGNGLPPPSGVGGSGNGLANNLGAPPAALASSPSNGLAAPRSSPMSTLPGRPPIIGPTAGPSMGDGLVPPRQIAVPAEMIPVMQTVPQPRHLHAPGHGPGPGNGIGGLGGSIGRSPPGSQHERPMQRPVVSRPMAVPDLAVDSGISVAPRFGNQNQLGGQSGGATALADEDVPRLTRRAKTTVALVAGGAVLLVAVIALAMTAGGDSLPATATAPETTPEASATESTTEPAAGATPSTEPASATATATEPAGSAGVAAVETTKTAEAIAAEKAANDKLVADKLAADKAAAEKAANDKLVADKLAADKAANDKAAAEKAANDKLVADKLAADKAAAEVAAVQKAEKAAADKAAKQEAAEKAATARAEKLAADKAAKQAAADKAAAARAKNIKDKQKTPAVASTRVAAAEPAGELDTESILGKAEDLYRKKNFSGAAAAIRDALRGRTGYDELRSTAQIYESLQRTYSAGTAPGAKPTEAYTNLRSASRYDDKLGKAHADDIGPRVTTLAPRAAAMFLATKNYEEAFQALRDAERAGASSSTLNSVRSAVEAHANDLFNQAQAKRESDPAAARSLYKKVLKVVEPGTPLQQRASAAFNELK